MMALQNPKSKDKSDRAIAEHVGVHHQLVGKIRDELEKVDESSTCPPNPAESHDGPKRRKGKDGKSYPAARSARDRLKTPPGMPPAPTRPTAWPGRTPTSGGRS